MKQGRLTALVRRLEVLLRCINRDGFSGIYDRNMEQQLITDSWLLVSAEGFRQQQAGRDPALLVKELLQNSLDASPTSIDFTIEHVPSENCVRVVGDDMGEGVEDFEKMRTVFWTSKTDSHHKRGRMGRGFKELLVLARSATVESNGRIIKFAHNEEGVSVVETTNGDRRVGTRVTMVLPWTAQDAEDIIAYFQRVLVPEGIELTVNRELIRPRPAKHITEAVLPTELFDGSRWLKPFRKTQIGLVPVVSGEIAFVYEMGIPIADLEWDQPYHIDVKQRVPMNPNRDAVASGYLTKVHRAALPVLVHEMDAPKALSDWVGSAAAGSVEVVQRAVVEKAFGNNAARSVPEMGKYSFDDDAREELDVTIVNTRHLAGGFKQLALRHIKSSREVVTAHYQQLALQKSMDADEADKLDQDAVLKAHVEAVGGLPRVERVSKFAKWFCDEILKRLHQPIRCTVRFGVLRGAEATWTREGAILTLSIAYEPIWARPLSRAGLQLLIHEVAHELSAHHGLSYAHSVENVAGVAAELMLEKHDTVLSKFADLWSGSQGAKSVAAEQTSFALS